MMINGLSLKITLPIVLISVLALGLTSFLNLGKFERGFDEIERSRIDFVLADVRGNLETGIDLGLALKDLANAQAIIDFQAGADADIISISLFDADGKVVFHTGTPLAELPPAWQNQGKDRGQPSWRLLEAGTLIVGTRLTSAIGTDAGGVLLQYSRRHRDAVIRTVARELLLASGLAVLLTAVLALLAISSIVHNTNRKLQQYAGSVDAP